LPYINTVWDVLTDFDMPYILESNPHPNLIRTSFCRFLKLKTKTKLRGLSPRANYTDRAAAAGRRS